MSTFASTTKKSAPAAGRVAAEITPDRVRARAYELFQARRGTPERGDAVSDWLQAERELRRGAAPAGSAEGAKAQSPR